MTDNQSISDDDISREGATENEDDRDTGAQHGKDTGDVSDDEPSEAVENVDVGGEGERATSGTTDSVLLGQHRGPTPLGRLVADPATFAEQAWGRTPHLTRHRDLQRSPDYGSSAPVLNDMLSIDDVDEFIAGGVRPPAVRMVRQGTILDPLSYCTATRLGGQALPDVVDGVKVAAQVAEGATLVLQSLHRQWDPIVGFADELMAEIGHPVQINAYLTPSAASGLRNHHDDHDVFVVQMAGRKHWTVAGVGDVDLGPGDVLYIPAGCAHAAATTDDLSLHLTIGILRITYRQVLERALVDGPGVLDQPLPLRFHVNGPSQNARTLEVGVAEMLTEVVDRLESIQVADVVDRERRRQLVPYSRRGHLRSVLSAPMLTQDSVLRWVTVMPRFQPVLDESDGIDSGLHNGVHNRVRVLLADRVLRLPVAAVAALEAVSGASRGLRVRDLPGLDPPSRVVVARRLVGEGACIIDPP